MLDKERLLRVVGVKQDNASGALSCVMQSSRGDDDVVTILILQARRRSLPSWAYPSVSSGGSGGTFRTRFLISVWGIACPSVRVNLICILWHTLFFFLSPPTSGTSWFPSLPHSRCKNVRYVNSFYFSRGSKEERVSA